MQHTYWPSWRKFLSCRGLVSPTCVLMDLTQPLLPVVAQMMILGLPLFKGAAMGQSYEALVNTLGDVDALNQFRDYLQEVGT